MEHFVRCVECEETTAYCRCTGACAGDAFCSACWYRIHAKGPLARHTFDVVTTHPLGVEPDTALADAAAAHVAALARAAVAAAMQEVIGDYVPQEGRGKESEEDEAPAGEAPVVGEGRLSPAGRYIRRQSMAGTLAGSLAPSGAKLLTGEEARRKALSEMGVDDAAAVAQLEATRDDLATPEAVEPTEEERRREAKHKRRGSLLEKLPPQL